MDRRWRCECACEITTDTSVAILFISFLSHQCHVKKQKKKRVFSMLCVIIERCGFKSGSHHKLGRGSGHPMCRAYLDVDRAE